MEESDKQFLSLHDTSWRTFQFLTLRDQMNMSVNSQYNEDPSANYAQCTLSAA